MAERLLLLDGHSLAYRAFYGLPAENFVTTSGQVTNAVYGFTSMLLTTLEQFQPTHIAVAFDVNRNTFRREQFPEYKANRAATPPEFKGQTELVTEVLDVLGIRHAALEGYEADDIIATLTSAASTQQAHISILTGDRDSMQLVSDNVTVLYPTKGVRELSRMTPAAVLEKFGVRPDQYADLAALRGDSSDNLPSIPGVGDKTAASWLSTYGDLNSLVMAAADIKGKVGENLREHVHQVLLNRRLTQLVHDVPLNASVDDLHRHLGQRDQINAIFDRLGFKQLRQRHRRALHHLVHVESAERMLDLEQRQISQRFQHETISRSGSRGLRCSCSAPGRWPCSYAKRPVRASRPRPRDPCSAAAPRESCAGSAPHRAAQSGSCAPDATNW